MTTEELRLPESTRQQLIRFQQHVRRIKIAEGLLAGIFGLAVSYVAVFALDRLIDTPAIARTLLLLMGSVGLAIYFPMKCHRWVWGTRRMEQVATLLKHKFPALGDQLLGVVELARAPSTHGSSTALARAAIQHVDQLVKDRDFSDAVPHPRHRVWALAAALPAALVLIALLLVPDAGRNAFTRWLTPWRDVNRYTFAQIQPLPEMIVVPQGEPFSLNAQLLPTSAWSPSTGKAMVNRQTTVMAERNQDGYHFSVPPQSDATVLQVRIGDIREDVQIRPASRPELTSLKATVQLPDYLQYTHPLKADVRGGSVSLVKGASAQFEAEISRSLQTATIQGTPSRVDANRIIATPVSIISPEVLELQWQDELGLSPREPFRLKINAVDDTAPSVSCLQTNPQQVVLSTEVITFEISANDDFGIREIGLAWSGSNDLRRHQDHAQAALASGNSEVTPEDMIFTEPDSESTPAEDAHPADRHALREQQLPGETATDPAEPPAVAEPDSGSKVAKAGSPEETQLKAVASFCAETDGVRPQRLELRAYAKDYHPDRAAVYSPVYVLHVMSPEEHAVWVADQLRRWASRADDVYEEELRLHETNRELRQLNAQELAQPDMQRAIEQQASAEQANAARLSAVTGQGKQLIQQAMRNPEMMVGHLETWAAALKQLDEIAGKRMPSVANLLTSAATPTTARPGQPGESTEESDAEQPPMAGHQRNTDAGKGNPKPPKPAGPAVPKLVDVESGFNKPQDDDPEAAKDKSDEEEEPASSGKFSIPETVLNGGPPQEKDDQDGPTQKKPDPLNQAVEDQADLLLEFEKVREDLQRIMDDLENSTFVKRFKAASRKQLEVAADLNRTLFHGFGVDQSSLDQRQSGQAEIIAEREDEQSRFVFTIQSDLEAWLSRRSEEKFVRILEEMKQTDVVLKLADVGARIRNNLSGDSIARAELWADTLDRWAEELVAVSKCGQCSGGNAASLPPAIVLEIMRILSGEIDLRDETRSLEQARTALPVEQHSERAVQQSQIQTDLYDRTQQVITDIRTLPDGEQNFVKELLILIAAGDAMSDAAGLLRRTLTGPEVIAAETEAIELLLQAKRANPKSSGGGGGSTPGGGGDGTTEEAALAMFGPGSDAAAVIQERGIQQATGKSSSALPEEFREGLDAFFNAVEDVATRNLR